MALSIQPSPSSDRPMLTRSLERRKHSISTTKALLWIVRLVVQQKAAHRQADATDFRLASPSTHEWTPYDGSNYEYGGRGGQLPHIQ